MGLGPAASFLRPFLPAAAAIRARSWGSLWLGPLVGVAILVCAGAQDRWHPAFLAYAASTPWRPALIRLPLSVIAPAQFLPCWGAVLQTVIVLAVVQPVLGVRRTVVVAMLSHVTATVAMRAMVHLAAADVPHTWLHEPDSGPSVAVLAAAVACAAATGSSVVAGLLAVGVLSEVVLLHGQAGVEHLVGVAVGLLLGALWRHGWSPEFSTRWPSLVVHRRQQRSVARTAAASPVPLRRTDRLRT